LSRIKTKGYSYILSNIKLNYNITYKNFTLKENNINTLKEFKALNKAYINKLLRETKCLRKVINKILNNNINYIKCNFNKELACSLCLLRLDKLNNKALLKEEFLRETNLGLINLKEKLKELNNICLYCLLLNNYKENIKHSINICKNKDLIIFLNKYSLNNIYYIIQEYIINNSLLKLGNACYTCLFPPRICARLKEEANSIKCLYLSLILNIISIL
jgi:serine/threonine protein kinase